MTHAEPGPATNLLVVTVGLPRAGKSTWAREQGHPVVNPDAIRLAIHGHAFIDLAEPWVWATAKAMVRSLFGAGHKTVILDATNVTHKRRVEWVGTEWDTAFKVFDAPEEECVRRAHETQRGGLVPTIGRMAAQWEPLRPGDPIYQEAADCDADPLACTDAPAADAGADADADDIWKRVMGYIRTGSRASRWREGGSYSRGRKVAIPVALDWTDLKAQYEKQNGRCHWYGVPLDPANNRVPFHPLAVSADRLDNARGYEPGNVVLCCRMANLGRSRFPSDDFRAVLSDIRRHWAATAAPAPQ